MKTDPSSTQPMKKQSSIMDRTGNVQWVTKWNRGDYFVWLTGGSLAVCLLMISAVVGVIVIHGGAYFWPKSVQKYELKSGGNYLGILRSKEVIPPGVAKEQGLESNPHRRLIMVGNRDLVGQDFVWINDGEIASTSQPGDVWVVERMEYGNFIGSVKSLVWNGEAIDPSRIVHEFPDWIDKAKSARARIYQIERIEIGRINRQIEELRIQEKVVRNERKGAELQAALERLDSRHQPLQKEYEKWVAEVDSIRTREKKNTVTLEASDGKTVTLPLLAIMDAWQPNQMNLFSKLGRYLAQMRKFIFDNPRESNTEGGIFPALYGTSVMVILMSVAVVPFGVLTAFYLCEYAKQGPLVRMVRIALNNLAGVPSIVYGMFGLGFFIYFVGGTIDQLFYPEKLPEPTWGTGGIFWASMTLALLTVPVVVMATEESIQAVPRGVREGSLALGASKFQTLRHILLPASMPGILTGIILAMARGSGEVAPLMITGVVKLAPSLPVDAEWPYLHLGRKFMHLGFHIYDVGFQSPNVEAARPMVFCTALLLLLLVVALNLAAILIRDYLRKKYATGAFN